MTTETYTIQKGKNLLEEITKIAEQQQLFHAQITGVNGNITEVKIVPTNFNTRAIETTKEFGLAKLDAVIKKTVVGYTAAPFKATIFNLDNPKISIEGELKAATTASEVTIEISKHDLSKIIS